MPCVKTCTQQIMLHIQSIKMTWVIEFQTELKKIENQEKNSQLFKLFKSNSVWLFKRIKNNIHKSKNTMIKKPNIILGIFKNHEKIN